MSNVVIERLNSAVSFVQRGAHAVKNGVVSAAQGVSNGYNFVGRKIEVLSDRFLARPLNTVVKDAYWGAPTTLALSLAIPPGLGLLAAATTNVVMRLFVQNMISSQSSERIYKGIRNFCIIGATADTVRAAVTGQFILLITLPIYAVVAISAHANAEAMRRRGGL